MSALGSLKEFVEQRLAAAVEEIFEYFEKTVTNYEEELERFRKLLDIMLQPEVRLRRGDVSSLTATSKIPCEQQEMDPSLHQEDPLPPRIKEEQDKVWTSQEGEQFPSSPSPVSVTSDEYEEKPELSQFDQNGTLAHPPADEVKTVVDGENCGGSEPAASVQSPSVDCSELEIKDKDDLTRCNGGKMCKSFNSLICEKRFCSKYELVMHKRGSTRDKPYSKLVQQSHDMKSHLRVHTAEKGFRCSDCGECFSHQALLRQHMMCHTGECPCSGSVCDQNT